MITAESEEKYYEYEKQFLSRSIRYTKYVRNGALYPHTVKQCGFTAKIIKG